MAQVPEPAATSPLSLAFKLPLLALTAAGAWRSKVTRLLKVPRRRSAHASAKVLDAVAPPSFGGALVPPFRTVVTTAPAAKTGVSWPVVPWANGYTAGSDRNLGEGRGGSEEKSDSSHRCESVAPHECLHGDACFHRAPPVRRAQPSLCSLLQGIAK